MDVEQLTQSIMYAFRQMTLMEVAAVFFSIIYIYLAARENIWCWAAAVVSVILYIIICIRANLLAETGLQFFYLFMAVFGYFQWRGGKNYSSGSRPIAIWSWQIHLLAIGSGLLLVFILGYLLESYTKAAMPYFDSFTTIFSMITTWMVTKKILENWLYWIVVDGSSVFLYANRELYLTALLFMAYTIIVIFGFFRWRKEYLANT